MNSLMKIIGLSIASVFGITGVINIYSLNHIKDRSKYEFSGYIYEDFVEFKTEKHFWSYDVNSLVIIEDGNTGVRLIDRNNDLIADEFWIKLPGKKLRKLSRSGEVNDEDIEIIIREQYRFQNYLEEIRRVKEKSGDKNEQKNEDLPYDSVRGS